MRHAESTANVKGILAGRIDPTFLSEKGLEAAASLREVIEKFKPELIKVSPMLRCRQTIESASAFEYEIDDRLIEMDYGKWNGRSLKRLSQKAEWNVIQSSPIDFVFPRGESFLQAWERISELLREMSKTDTKRIIFVTHGDISRMIIAQLLGEPLNNFQRFMVEPGSHSLLMTHSNGKTAVGYLNRLEVSASKREASKLTFQVGGE